MALKFQNKPIPVKLDDSLVKRIEEVAAKMGESKSTVMRIAMRIGLEGLDKLFASAPALAGKAARYPEHKPSLETLNAPPASSESKKADQELLDVIEKHYPSPKARRK